MTIKTPLSAEKKLMVLFHVEPGCLGPDGISLVTEYCDIAQKKIEKIDSDYIAWCITPRTDKTLPELQFNIDGKLLSREQAEKYLSLFDIDIDELEAKLYENITDLVEEFLGRNWTADQ